MRRPQYTITAQAIHEHAAALCQKHLRLQDHGPKCTAPTLLTLLLYAAARLTSLAAACASLSQAPSDTAVRTALLATLPPIHELQRRTASNSRPQRTSSSSSSSTPGCATG